LAEFTLSRFVEEVPEGALSLAHIGFRVLGPVEIVAGGRAAGPTTSQLRCVLAMLLVDEGRVVAAGRLISALWPSAPPANALNTIRVYISRLRKLLGGDPDVALATVGQGWRLDCDRERVDLYRFRALVARAASEDVDPEAARALLREALGLWRGPAFADVAGDWLAEVVGAGLEDERLAAVERRIALDLRSSAHRELVPELTTLVAQNPLRERLVQLLMSALHRSGRTAEGLEVYQRARRSLIDELGIEPGPDLRDEYRRLLGAPAEERAVQPVPRQLPSGISAFAGRVEALAALDSLLSRHEDGGAPLVVTLNGLPGAGKTTLAVHWARSVAERFPGGSLYVNLRGFGPAAPAVDPAEALRGFLVALGIPGERIPDGLDARAAAYRSMTADRRMLVLLDNARDEDQVRPLLPVSGGSCAVVASRRQLTGLAAKQGARALHVDMVNPVEARDLLERRLGDRVRAEPEAVERIVRRCAGLPLSLAIVAARTEARGAFPLAAIADELDSAVPVLDAFESHDATVDLRTVFSWSYRGLGPDAARQFRLLGLHWGPDFGVEAAASLAGQPVRETRRLLDELCRMRLLVEAAPGRFGFHDLLAAYAAELAEAVDTASDRRDALRRLLDHCLHSAHAAADAMAPYRLPALDVEASAGSITCVPRDHEQAAAWFASEHTSLANAMVFADRSGFEEYVWRLAPPYAIHLRRQGRGAELLAARSLAAAAAERSGDAPAEAAAFQQLAAAQIRFGDPREAERNLQAALQRYRDLGDLEGEAETSMIKCLFGDAAGDYTVTLEAALKSLDLFRRTGNGPGQARALNNIGFSHTMLGDYERAAAFGREALEASEKLGDPVGVAVSLDSLGLALALLGRYEEAIDCYRRSATLLLERGEKSLAAVTLTRLGEAHQAVGDHEAVVEVWKRALATFEELNHPGADELRARLAVERHAATTRRAPRS
jgi:DNA-binding SARP family transcriptional activator/tetratricopeptide (TPR) repeat protein